MIERLMASWKTTAAGVALLAVTTVYLLGRITTDQYVTVFGLLAGGGLVLAKDANVSGGK